MSSMLPAWSSLLMRLLMSPPYISICHVGFEYSKLGIWNKVCLLLIKRKPRAPSFAQVGKTSGRERCLDHIVCSLG